MTRIIWNSCWICLIFPLMSCEKSVEISMPSSSCGRDVKEISGALLVNDIEYSMVIPCELRLKASSDNGLLQLKFLNVTIQNCSVQLEVYFKDRAEGDPKYSFTCTTTDIPKIVNTESNVVTFFLTKKLSSRGSFKIVVTDVIQAESQSFQGGSEADSCDEFLCNSGQWCIDSSLVCDGVNNCLDDSDESDDECRSIVNQWVTTVAIVMYVLLSLLGMICTCCSLVYICYAYQYPPRQQGKVLRPAPVSGAINNPVYYTYG